MTEPDFRRHVWSDLIGAATAEKVLFVFKVAVHLFNLPTIVYDINISYSDNNLDT